MRFPWVRRSELRELQKALDLTLNDLALYRRENLALREELSEVAARIRLEDSLLQYLEVKGVELLREQG